MAPEDDRSEPLKFKPKPNSGSELGSWAMSSPLRLENLGLEGNADSLFYTALLKRGS